MRRTLGTWEEKYINEACKTLATENGSDRHRCHNLISTRDGIRLITPVVGTGLS
ncbi:MAG: hypothetical protein JWP91_4204 [Fibrobacteres bacterium]|nr:hypothetical protein [Fibrobacterota bacterium]